MVKIYFFKKINSAQTRRVLVWFALAGVILMISSLFLMNEYFDFAARLCFGGFFIIVFSVLLHGALKNG